MKTEKWKSELTTYSDSDKYAKKKKIAGLVKIFMTLKKRKKKKQTKKNKIKKKTKKKKLQPQEGVTKG